MKLLFACPNAEVTLEMKFDNGELVPVKEGLGGGKRNVFFMSKWPPFGQQTTNPPETSCKIFILGLYHVCRVAALNSIKKAK